MRLLISLLLSLLFYACTSERTPEPRHGFSAQDDLGRVVSLPHVPSRIVSLSPHVTEILFALGLDSAIVGVTDYCDYPPAALSVPRVGGLTSPNFERLVELHPDVIIMTVSGNSRQDFESLERLNFRVFVTNPRGFKDVFESIRRIGLLTGRAKQGDSLATALRQRADSLIASVESKAKIPTLFLLSVQPIISVGYGTYLHELIVLAGGINVAEGSSIGYPLLSKEEILKKRPQVIVVSSDVAIAPAEIARAWGNFSTIPAIADHRIRIIDADLVSRPGPRIVDGLAALIRAIHETTEHRP